MPLTRRTLAALAGAISDCLMQAEMDALFYEFALESEDPGGSVRKRSVAFMRALESNRGPDEIEAAAQEITEQLLSRRYPPHLLEKEGEKGSGKRGQIRSWLFRLVLGKVSSEKGVFIRISREQPGAENPPSA